MEEKVCGFCGRVFMPKKQKQKFCSISCGSKAQSKPKYHICLNCGKEYRWTDGHPHKFCSRVCLRQWQKEHKVVKPQKESIIYNRQCEWCGEPFSTKRNNQKYCSTVCRINADSKRDKERRATTYVSRTFICKECGTSFTTRFTDTHSIFCCKSCAEKYKRRVEHKTERHKTYMKHFKSQRRKQIRDNFIEEVSYDSVFNRDKGICRICGLPVVYDKHADNNWSGTIDHIVPISLNGEHSMKNCQLAHRLCNSLKNNSVEHFSIDWEQKSKENNYWASRFRVLKEKIQEKNSA